MGWMDKYASLYPNYQQGAQQQGAIWANAIQQLAQMASQYKQKSDEDAAVRNFLGGERVIIPEQYTSVPMTRQIVNPGATATWIQPQDGAQFSGNEGVLRSGDDEVVRSAQSNAIVNNPFIDNRDNRIETTPATTTRAITPAWLRQGLSSPFARVREAAQMEHLLSKEDNLPYTLGEGEVRYVGNKPIAVGLPKPNVLKVGYRDVVENGGPKTILRDGIRYKIREAYDEQSGESLVGKPKQFEKVDDQTSPSMYSRGDKDDIELLAQSLANYDLGITEVPRQDKTSVWARAKEINPMINHTTYTANKKLKESYTSGAYSRNIVSLNTVVGHIADLKDAGEALKNGNLQILNRIANAWNRQTGNSAPDVFATVRDAVANELATTFKGSSGTDIGLQKILDAMYSAQSPEQIKDVVKSMTTLIISRMNAINANYKKRTGVDFPVLDEDKKIIVESILGKSITHDAGGKVIQKKAYSKTANKTKIIYSDGTEEIVDGRQ